MRRFIKCLSIFLFIMCLFQALVYAGDINMMVEDGQQDAFIIGKIKKIQMNGFDLIEVKKVLLGNLNKRQVIVKHFHYYGNAEPIVPKEKDYCVIALDRNKKGSFYEIANSASFKADCDNYRKLKLEKAKLRLYENVREMQSFINQGNFIKQDKINKKHPIDLR